MLHIKYQHVDSSHSLAYGTKRWLVGKDEVSNESSIRDTAVAALAAFGNKNTSTSAVDGSNAAFSRPIVSIEGGGFDFFS